MAVIITVHKIDQILTPKITFQPLTTEPENHNLLRKHKDAIEISESKCCVFLKGVATVVNSMVNPRKMKYRITITLGFSNPAAAYMPKELKAGF